MSLMNELAAEREAGVKALAERSFELYACQKQLAAERGKVQTLVDALKRAEGAIRSEDHIKMGLALVVIRDRLAKVRE